MTDISGVGLSSPKTTQIPVLDNGNNTYVIYAMRYPDAAQ